MKMRTFLRFVLPDIAEQSCFYVLRIDPGRTVSESWDAVDDAVKYASTHLNSNLYYTPFLFNHYKERKQQYAFQCRCLFLDLDVGEGKAYDSKREALGAVLAFCDKTGIPKPNGVLDTGNGVHTYWVFEPVRSAAEWQTAADGFKQLCQDSGLAFDPVVTADSARVMRLPDTLNFRNGKHPTRVIHHADRFESWACVTDKLAIGSAAVVTQVPDYMLGNDVDSEIGKLSSMPDPRFANIVRACPLLKDIHATGGEHCAEPLWRNALLVLSYCEDANDYVHPVSEKHSGYSEAETNRKYARIVNGTRVGPTRCDTFERVSYNPGLCTGCDHHGDIKSPIVLGYPKAEPSQPPKNFEVHNGRIFTTGENPHQVCRSFDLTVEEYEVGGEKTTTVLVMHNHDKQPATLDFANIHDIGKLRGATGATLGIRKTALGSFDKLMTGWVDELRESNNGFLSMEGQVGWGDDWGSFAFTDRMLRFNLASGSIETVPLYGLRKIPSVSAVHEMHKRGAFATWQAHAQQVIDTGVTEVHTIMAQSFAAALTDLVADPPAVMLLVSKQSGVGKTTMFRTANSVWFAPDRGINMSDTENYINGTIMASRNVPIFWDELQLMDDSRNDRDKGLRSTVSIIFRILQGADKGRMNSNAQLREKQTNRPLVVISSNLPLAEMFAEYHVNAPEAMSARTLQLDITGRPSGHFSTNPLREHYGLAGERFVRYLMGLGKAHVQDLVVRVTNNLLSDPKRAKIFNDAGRMWRSSVVLTLVAGKLVNDAGILKIDLQAVKDRMLSAVTETRKSTSQAATGRDAVSLLGDIIQEAQGRGDVVETQTPPTRGAGKPVVIDGMDARLVVWLVPKAGWARIRSAVLERELQRRRVTPRRAIEELASKGLLIPRVSANADPRQYERAMRGPCYDVDMNLLTRELKNRPL